MLFYVFSDFHIHPHTQFARTNEDGINSRLAECIEAFDKILNDGIIFPRERRVDGVLFGGDLFHLPRIDAQTATLTSSRLKTLKMQLGIENCIFNVGNHGFSSFNSPFHIASIISEHVWWENKDRVVEWPNTNGPRIGVIPYHKNGKEVEVYINQYAEKGIRYFLIHQGINGAQINCSFVSEGIEDAINLDSINPYVKLIIAGHYHRPQILKNEYTTALIPGSPLAHSFADTDYKRGYWRVEFKDNGDLEIDQIDLQMPRFLKIDSTNLSNLDRLKGNYIYASLANNVKRKTVDHLRQVLEAQTKGFVIDIQPKRSLAEVREKDINVDTSWEKMIDIWLQRSKIESKEIRDLGITILEESR